MTDFAKPRLDLRGALIEPPEAYYLPKHYKCFLCFAIAIERLHRVALSRHRNLLSPPRDNEVDHYLCEARCKLCQ